VAVDIELRGVTRRYGDHTALGPVDLRVEAATTLCLLGPSGCGKSTLLRAVVGLVTPDEGTVRVGDTAVTPATVPALRRRMGYVIQEGGLFPHLTARENAALMARHLGWKDDAIGARVAELAALVRLPEAMLDRHPQALSGGQRQRVGLMRALMLDPEVLLLDEPLGALDPLVRADLQRDLRDIFQTLKRTVLMVTHDLREARVLSDEVALMREGRVVQRGTVDALEHAPADAFVTKFLGAWQ
jgi:osmoprotectant transport system ATP-binding protein